MRRILLALVLGVATSALLAWAAPLACVAAGWARAPRAYGPSGAGSSRDVWWGDDAGGHARSGAYTLDRTFLFDSVDMRRILFQGRLADQAFYRTNPPPAWARVISSDMREGFEEVLTVAQGWPLRCVTGAMWIDWTPSPAPTPLLMIQPNGVVTAAPPAPLYRLEGARLWTLASGEQVITPYRVNTVRAGANVGMLSAAWWAALTAIVWARRGARRFRGRCARCGYDLRGLVEGAACPECGTPME